MHSQVPTIQENINGYVFAGALVFIGLMLFFLIFLVFSLRRRRRMNLEKKELQARFREELLQSQLEIQEQTFKTIAQEIHDNIGQVLTLAKLNLNTIDLEKREKALEKVGDAKQLVGNAIQDLRDLSKSLNTDTISATGLIKAIENELHILQKTGALNTSFSVSGAPVPLDPQKELILFRVVQEAIHNVIKHAEATTLSIQAHFEHGLLKLLIQDDGKGLPAAMEAKDGSGLRNMQSRSQLIGAQWRIENAAPKGALVSITLPITN